MSVKYFMCFFVLLISHELHHSVSAEEYDSDYDSSEENIFEKLGYKQEPFRLIENLIDEARAIIMGVLRGELSDEIKKEIEKKDIDINGSYDGVSRLVRKCLKKAKNKDEGKEIVKQCFEQAVRERQNEEVAEQGGGQQTIQSCIQEAMLDASQSAAPLMVEAQEYGAMFREMIQSTAGDMMTCRTEERPFQCMAGVWANAQQNMTFMRDQIIEVMLTARDIYIQYMDEVRQCITPVEEVDVEEEDEDDVIEDEGTKIDFTPSTQKTETEEVTQSYYDPVDEARRKPLAKLPTKPWQNKFYQN